MERVEDMNWSQGHGANARRWISECDTIQTTAGHRLSYRRRGFGASVLMLHGFPTWSFDYAEVAANLEKDHDTVTLDFLGYGASDKPKPYRYSVTESADLVEELVQKLGLKAIHMVAHDYGAIVCQELLDRHRRHVLPFDIAHVFIMNSGIVYKAYRPTRLQKFLRIPLLGGILARHISPERLRAALDRLMGGNKTTDIQFGDLWYGISLRNGHKLSNLLIRYNNERDVHHARWEWALRSWKGPLTLMWGLMDPVSGSAVLEQARETLPTAKVVALTNVGHFPMIEDPLSVATAIREGAAGR
jgi:pimeloyl-ACP methyl ester carboxylesterase